jgi:hypothetical protein
MKLLQISTEISYIMNNFTDVVWLNFRFYLKFGNKLTGLHYYV